MTPLVGLVGTVGVDHLLEMAQGASPPGWVQPSGRRQEHRVGLGGQVGGQVLGAVGDHRGVGGRDLPGGEGGRGAGKGPRNNARAVRTELAAAPAAIRSRRRSQLAVEGAATP